MSAEVFIHVHVSVDWVSIKVIDGHLAADAVSTHDPSSLLLFLIKFQAKQCEPAKHFKIWFS